MLMHYLYTKLTLLTKLDFKYFFLLFEFIYFLTNFFSSHLVSHNMKIVSVRF